MKGGFSADLGRYALLAPLLVSTVLAVLVSLGLILALSFQTVDVTCLFTTPMPKISASRCSGACCCVRSSSPSRSWP